MPYTLNGRPVSDEIAQGYLPTNLRTPGAGAYPSSAPVVSASGAPSTSTTGGGGPYGSRPAPLAVPPTLWQQASSAIPGLGSTGSTATNFAASELSGALSPATIQAIEDASAAWGVGAGIPGTQPGT